jgi:hypothetical protein
LAYHQSDQQDGHYCLGMARGQGDRQNEGDYQMEGEKRRQMGEGPKDVG